MFAKYGGGAQNVMDMSTTYSVFFTPSLMSYPNSEPAFILEIQPLSVIFNYIISSTYQNTFIFIFKTGEGIEIGFDL